MSALAEQLSEDLKGAMRAGDAVRRDEIRGLLAALKAERQSKLTRELDKQGLILRNENDVLSPDQQREVDRLRTGSELTDDDELAVLQQRVKQHRQSIESFERGHREDLVATERAQLTVIEQYLPKQMDAQAVDEAIHSAIASSGARSARDQGKGMGILSATLRGRADMKAVSARVQALLATGS